MFSVPSRHFLVIFALLWLVVAASSAAAAPVTRCDSVAPVLSAQGMTVTCELTETEGAAATIAVPAGTIRIDVTVRGGGGGQGGLTSSFPGYAGGSGAQVEASLLPLSSTALTVKVGGGGNAKGGLQGGTGGGFSAIYEGVVVDPDKVIVVAGGGGGGGYGTRCTAGGTGGSGGFGGSGEGGDTPGRGGDGSGPGGLGGAVPSPLTGTPGFNGTAWSAGGTGGAGGTTRGGNGGDGHGGGGGGGFVDAATAIVCSVASAINDGSGGGAGGSYMLPGQSIRTAYSNAGGSGGRWVGGVLDPGTSGSVTLTFVGATYTVTYDANGGADRVTGSPPVDTSSPYLSESRVTVLGNTGALTRDGFVFDGWNTARDGSGTSYAPTNTFAISANTILYAQWKALPSAPITVQNTLAAQNTPAAMPTLRTTKPKTTATGATVTFTAPGPGTATAIGTAAQATRASATVCRGTTKASKAGKAVVTCALNATGRRLRAKGALTVTLTTSFAAKSGARLQATSTVVFPRRG